MVQTTNQIFLGQFPFLTISPVRSQCRSEVVIQLLGYQVRCERNPANQSGVAATISQTMFDDTEG